MAGIVSAGSCALRDARRVLDDDAECVRRECRELEAGGVTNAHSGVKCPCGTSSRSGAKRALRRASSSGGTSHQHEDDHRFS